MRSRDLLDRVQARREDRWLAGRSVDGMAPTAPEQSATWIVTDIDPVLMAQPLTGGPGVTVQATDAVRGVKVGMRIRVESRGMGSRVAVALIDAVTLVERNAGEQIGTVNGRPLQVGGSVSLSASDVDALPDTANYQTVDAASETHRHTVSLQSYSRVGWNEYAYIGSAPATYDPSYLNQIRNQVNGITRALSYVELWVLATQGSRTTSTPTG